MKRILFASVATIAPVMAFAGAKGAASEVVTPPTPAPTPAVTDAATTPKRGSAEVTAVRTDIEIPERARSNRGSISPYPFSALTVVGASFGLKGKSKKNLGSIITNQNKKGVTHKKGDAITDANGVQVGVHPANVVVAHYTAVDVDPSTDPDGASVRVFRDK